MHVNRIAARGKVGEVSSKYGYSNGGELFEADMKAHAERCEFLWNEFVEFMKSHDAIPSEFRWIFRRYYKEFIEDEP